MSEQEAAAAPAAAGSEFTPAVPEAVEPPKKSGGVIKKIIGFVVVAGIVIAIKVGLGAGLSEVWANITGDVSTASVGDCVNNFAVVDDAKVVDCASPDAKNKVVGIVEDVTESEFTTKEQTLCNAFPTWEQVVWIGRKGGNGDSWCLEPIKK